jgi:hypothetical protein
MRHLFPCPQALTAAAEGESRASTHACDYFAQFNPSAPSSYFEPGPGGMPNKQKVKRVRRQPVKPLLEVRRPRRRTPATDAPFPAVHPAWSRGLLAGDKASLSCPRRSPNQPPPRLYSRIVLLLRSSRVSPPHPA